MERFVCQRDREILSANVNKIYHVIFDLSEIIFKKHFHKIKKKYYLALSLGLLLPYTCHGKCLNPMCNYEVPLNSITNYSDYDKSALKNIIPI